MQIIEDLPAESAKRLAGNKNITIFDLKDFWLHGAWVNHHRAPTNDLRVRRAMQLALDMDEIMEISTDGAYALQPGLQYPGNPYYVTDGKEFYNAKDPKKAAALLKEAGYKGEELVIITNSSYQSMYKAAQIVSEQLKAVGFKVRVDVFDWATAMNRRTDKDAWNLWFTGQGSGPIGRSVLGHEGRGLAAEEPGHRRSRRSTGCTPNWCPAPASRRARPRSASSRPASTTRCCS